MRAYFGVFSLLVDSILKVCGLDLKWRPSLLAGRIDDRITKIDAARSNLQDALEALDELTSEADRNKRELEDAVKKLEHIKVEHANKSTQLDELKKIAQSDIDTFRTLAGIQNPIKEMIVGFIGGVFASLVASLIWYVFFQKMNGS